MTPAPDHLVHRDALVAQLVTELLGLQYREPKAALWQISGCLKGDDFAYDFSLQALLKVLDGGLYWDERGNWGDATVLVLFTE